MALGYDGKLYILAFDHRGSFQKKMFGIEGDPTPEETERIADAKHLIFEGMVKATEIGSVPGDQVGVLVDEQFGGSVPAEAKERGPEARDAGREVRPERVRLRVRRRLRRAHPEVRPRLLEGPRPLQPRRRRRAQPRASSSASSAWPTGCTSNDRKFLFELLVPATDEQLASVGGDTDRYDAELRPELMRRAIAETQDFGCEVDIWKIEGVDAREDAEMLAKQTREGAGREGVVCVLLGRGASDEKVDQWLRAASPVEGFVGFAIGRSIWWDALKGFLDGSLEREAAATQIAENYLRFIRVYEEQETAVA